MPFGNLPPLLSSVFFLVIANDNKQNLDNSAGRAGIPIIRTTGHRLVIHRMYNIIIIKRSWVGRGDDSFGKIHSLSVEITSEVVLEV